MPLAQKPYLQHAEVQVGSSVSDHGVSMGMLFSTCKDTDKVVPVRGADQDNAVEYLQSVINLFDDAGGSNMEKQNEEEISHPMAVDEETQQKQIDANKRRQSFTVHLDDILTSFDLFEDDDDDEKSVKEPRDEEKILATENNFERKQEIEDLDQILNSFEDEESLPEHYEENSRWAGVRARGVAV